MGQQWRRTSIFKPYSPCQKEFHENKNRFPSKHIISVVESYPMACGFQDVRSLTDCEDDRLPQYSWPAFVIKQRA